MVIRPALQVQLPPASVTLDPTSVTLDPTISIQLGAGLHQRDAGLHCFREFSTCGLALLTPALSSFGEEREKRRRALAKWRAGV